MTVEEIAQRVGFMWNGVWQVDEAKFRRAIELARTGAFNEAIPLCTVQVMREPGHGGTFEGYGKLKTHLTGPECADAIERLRDANVPALLSGRDRTTSG